jgi:hypothetical protein
MKENNKSITKLSLGIYKDGLYFILFFVTMADFNKQLAILKRTSTTTQVVTKPLDIFS